MNILMVLTSHDQLGDTGDKTGYWLEELAAPYCLFQDADADITLASPRGGKPPVDPRSEESDSVHVKRFQEDKQAQEALANTVKLKDIKPGEYDAVFYPGGHGPMYDLVDDKDSIKLIESVFKNWRPVVAICHGPAVLVNARGEDGKPLVNGRYVTGFSNSEEEAVGLTKAVPFLIEDKLKELGGIYSKADDWLPHVMTDENLITGQNPASSYEAALTLVMQLRRKRKVTTTF